jgi:hypothetical protein
MFVNYIVYIFLFVKMNHKKILKNNYQLNKLGRLTPSTSVANHDSPGRACLFLKGIGYETMQGTNFL